LNLAKFSRQQHASQTWQSIPTPLPHQPSQVITFLFHPPSCAHEYQKPIHLPNYSEASQKLLLQDNFFSELCVGKQMEQHKTSQMSVLKE
jgi:hypothetical protein